jgi:hypothetical protein
MLPPPASGSRAAVATRFQRSIALRPASVILTRSILIVGPSAAASPPPPLQGRLQTPRRRRFCGLSRIDQGFCAVLPGQADISLFCEPVPLAWLNMRCCGADTRLHPFAKSVEKPTDNMRACRRLLVRKLGLLLEASKRSGPGLHHWEREGDIDGCHAKPRAI